MLFTVQIPVAEGAHDTFAGIKKDWVPDFVHGDDGFGNMNFPEVQVRQTPTLDMCSHIALEKLMCSGA